MKFTTYSRPTTWTTTTGSSGWLGWLGWSWYTDPPTSLVPAKIEPRPPVDSDSTAQAVPT